MAMKIPMPAAAMKTVKPKICKPPWVQAKAWKLPKRTRMAPIGKRATKAMAARAPWTCTKRFCACVERLFHAPCPWPGLEEVFAAPVNGLLLEPPVARDMSHWNAPSPSCCEIATFVSSELIGDPWRCAYSQLLLLLWRLMVPVAQLVQLPHRTLAVILPLAIPEPSRRETSTTLLCVGITCPGAFRGESVTFLPSAELYMRNMLALLIIVPCASATQEYAVGADN